MDFGVLLSKNLKTLKTHFFGNVALMHFSVLILTSWETLETYVFGKVVLFLHEGCFTYVFVPKKLKTLKSHFLGNVLFNFPYRMLCIHFDVLVPKKFENTYNIRFW